MTHPAPSLAHSPVRIRHIIRDGLPVTPDEHERGVGGDVVVLGKTYRPSWGGLNGDRGFTTGEFDRRMFEEGEFRLRLPNASGEDGRLHRERFALVNEAIPDVRPGDEWIEVYEGDPGHLVYVACPLDFEQRRGSLEIQGADPLWTLRTVREFEAGFWCTAPRDVFEHYTRVWVAPVAEDFTDYPITYVDDATTRTTADGRFEYLRAGTTSLPGTPPNPPAGRVRLAPNATSGVAQLNATETFEIGMGAADEVASWRLEVRIWRSAFVSTDNVRIGLRDDTTEVVTFRMEETQTLHKTADMSVNEKDGFNTKRPGPFYIVIEQRDRWIFYYLNGKLTAVAPAVMTPFTVYPYVRVATAPGGSADSWADVDSMIWRITEPYLMRDTDKGDYHLGSALGDLSSGGLQAIYYDDHDLVPNPDVDEAMHMLHPVKKPYSRKLEDTINFTGSAWAPVGPANANRWSVRFVGSVYLDLEANDIALGVNTNTAKRKRLYVGKTRLGEHVVDSWEATHSGRASSGGLRAHLGTISGWYPIILEYGTTGVSGTLILEQDEGVDGSWTTVPETRLSPIGIYLAHVRGESHYDQLRAVAEAFGLQFRCDPRQLESGFFPGHVAPKIRVGRDTEKVIDKIEADDYGKTGTIREVADTIFADASGIADPESGAQLTAEVADYFNLESRVWPIMFYDQAGEIDYEPMLRRRLDVLLALRKNVWEEVGAIPKGARELLDRFPLTEDVELFAWEPGDGVRLRIEEVGIMDAVPRQILGVRRTFRPDGLLRPIVSFRPRPRDFITLLRGMQVSQRRWKRSYQSQLVVVNSGLAAENDTTTLAQTARLPMPQEGEKIVKVWFILHTVAGGTWNVNVNGTNPALVGLTEPGRYDVTPWAEQDSAGAQISATVTATAGGTNIVRFSLEALVSV